MNIYTRKNIREMEGYTPGEQPKEKNLIKLNTNENPYPPSPKIGQMLSSFSCDNLRLYPDPSSTSLREAIAYVYDVSEDNIITGNGSDDILTIAVRTFIGENEKSVCFTPSYSLYEVLAKIQNAAIIKIKLGTEFEITDEFLQRGIEKINQKNNAKLFLIANPNSPTGNAFPLEQIEKICSEFQGVVLVDEAYADFADFNSVSLVKKYNNLIVTRTLSKSYALAGARLGWAISSKDIIKEMFKVKDSYNVNMLTQLIAKEALSDQKYLKTITGKIKASRNNLSATLSGMGFRVIPSQSNFILTSPPDRNGEALFSFLRTKNIITRYFSNPEIKEYIRITVGKETDMATLINSCRDYLNQAGNHDLQKM